MRGDILDEPITRVEQYLSAISGNETQVPERPITRVERYLAAILESGGGGGSGTTDYEALRNKPSINGVTLSGNIELADIMEDVTPTSVEEAVEEAGVEEAVEDAGLEDIVADAWNAAFDGG